MTITAGPRRRTMLGAGLGALVGTLAACSGDPVPRVARLHLATGPPGAVYREMGAALAEVWNEALGAEVVQVLPSDAAVQNRRMLLAGEADLAFVNTDVAQDGTDDLVALLRVFDSVLHLVVPQHSTIRSLADLQGRAVGLGLPSSGTRFVCERLLSLAGVSVGVLDLSQSDAAAAILAGTADAMFSLTAMPTPAITGLIEGPESFRFIDLTDAAASLRSAHPGVYLQVTISAALYPGIAPVASLAVPTLLMTLPEFPDDVARFLTAVVMERSEDLRDLRPEASQINPRTAIATAPARLHPAAADYFRSVKL